MGFTRTGETRAKAMLYRPDPQDKALKLPQSSATANAERAAAFLEKELQSVNDHILLTTNEITNISGYSSSTSVIGSRTVN